MLASSKYSEYSQEAEFSGVISWAAREVVLVQVQASSVRRGKGSGWKKEDWVRDLGWMDKW